jgi:hypothetical protein
MATYTITTLDELQEMASHLDDLCVLANDIDASETRTWNYADGIYNGFAPIGTYYVPFKGSFDGGGFTIRNLYINRPDASDEIGLFCRLYAQEEKITNGDFAAATGWTFGLGWSLISGKADKAAGNSGTLSQASAAMTTVIAAGDTYRLVFSMSSRTAGTCTVTCGGVTVVAASDNLTYTTDFTATNTDALVFTPSGADDVYKIDNVSLARYMVIKDVNILDADITGGDAAAIGILSGDQYQLTGLPNVVISGINVSGKLNSYSCSGMMRSGQNCTISNCTSNVDITITQTGCGIIGGGFNLTITNCHATGSIVKTGISSGAFGGFCVSMGTASGNSTCDNCSASVGILDLSDDTTSTQKDIIGGFSSGGYAGIFTECISYTNIVVTGHRYIWCGGFFGERVTGGSNIYRCAATGSISAKNPYSPASGYSRIGGFISSSADLIQDCYSHVDICKTGVNSEDNWIGGFAGQQSGSSITRCYCTGYVPSASAYCGGMIGYKYDGNSNYCLWDTDTSGHTNAVGTLKAGENANEMTGYTTAEMKLQATYETEDASWDFTTVWEITTFEQGVLAPTNLTVWLSQTDDYDSFAEGTNDSESFTVVVPSTNEIRWIQSLESLLVGTSGDEWRVGSNKLETAITPTNYKVEQQTEYGSSLIQPIKINASLIYVDYVGRKLREMSFTGDKYESLDLSALAEDITVGGITSMARQKNPDSIIWCTLETGELLSFTYDRTQNVLAWSEHPLGGTDVEAQSVSVIPGTTEDEVYITVQRTVNDATVIYLEKMSSRTFTDIEDCFFVDCGITFETATSKAISAFANYNSTVAGTTKVTSAAHTLTTGQEVIIDGTTNYDGTYIATVIDATNIYITKTYVANDATGSLYIPVSTITGLTHLVGETVQILGDGVVLGEEVVNASGEVTSDVAVLKAQVGLSYTWKVSPMRLVVDGEEGSSIGSNIRVSQLIISFLNTLGAKYYTVNSTSPETINFSDSRWTNEELITDLFTGDVLVSLPGGFSPQTPIVITGDDPLPATVRCLIARAEKTGL